MAEYVFDQALLGEAPQGGGQPVREYYIAPELLGEKADAEPKKEEKGIIGGAIGWAKEVISGPENLRYKGAKTIYDYLKDKASDVGVGGVWKFLTSDEGFKPSKESYKALKMLRELQLSAVLGGNEKSFLHRFMKEYGDRIVRVEDDNGYPVVVVREGDNEIPLYINAPGIDSKDINNFLLSSLPYMAAGGVVGGAARTLGLAGRMASHGAAMSGTALATGLAENVTGGHKSAAEIAAEAGSAAIGGAAGEFVGTKLASYLAKRAAKKLVDDSGKLTEKGIELAKKVGIEAPEELSPESARKFAELYYKVDRQYRIPDNTGKSALARKIEIEDIGIQGTTPQYTRNPDDQAFLKDIVTGAYGERAQAPLLDVIPAQGRTAAQIDKGVGMQVLPATEKTTLERVGGVRPDAYADVDAAVLRGLKRRYEDEVAPARKIMPDKNVDIYPRKKHLTELRDMLEWAERPKSPERDLAFKRIGIDDDVVAAVNNAAVKAQNGETGHEVQAYKLLKRWTEGKYTNIRPPDVTPKEWQKMVKEGKAELAGIFHVRNRISELAEAAANEFGKTSGRTGPYGQVAAMRDLVDGYILDLIKRGEAGGISDDLVGSWLSDVSIDTLRRWREGMDIYRDVNRKFFKRYANDEVGKLIRKLMDEDKFDPGTVTNYLLNNRAHIDRTKFAARLKELLGENSPEWALIKGRVIDQIMRKPSGEYRSISQAIDEFGKLKRTGPWEAIFTPEERKRIERFLKAAASMRLSDSRMSAAKGGIFRDILKRVLIGQGQGAAAFEGKPIKGAFYKLLARIIGGGMLGKVTGGAIPIPSRIAEKFARGWLPEATGAPGVIPGMLAMPQVSQPVVGAAASAAGSIADMMKEKR